MPVRRRLRARAALITGGSKGIGFGVAKALAAEGCHIRLVARTAADLDKAKADLARFQRWIVAGAAIVRVVFARETLVIRSAGFARRSIFNILVVRFAVRVAVRVAPRTEGGRKEGRPSASPPQPSAGPG